jgi:hypothetical protein
LITQPALASGRNVTLFFETPGWPTGSHKIEVRGSATGGSGNGHTASLVAAPNVCLSDADSYLFLRGGSVYANNGAASNGIHVVYSATLSNIALPAGSTRESSTNFYWIRPGDTFDFTNPYTGTAGTNIGTDGTRTKATVTSVRQRGGRDNLIIEFSIPIATAAVQGYAGGSANWAAWDVIFFQGASAGAATASQGLSYNQLTIPVASTSNWSATLSSAVNLSYPAANRPGLFVPSTSGGAAGLVDPGKMLVCNAASLAANGRQMYIQLDGVDPPQYNFSHVFEHRPDFNQGSVPYRCISFSASDISNPTLWAVEVLVHPLH